MTVARGGWRESPWLALGIILLGTYGATLNLTVVGVALPNIADDVGGGLDVDWVVTAYLLGVVASQPSSAWLADRHGRAPIYVGALALFGLGALVCAVAPDMSVLVGGRLVQGLGGGGLMPVGMTLLYERFPENRRGTAIGIWGIGVSAAPALGPPLGGWMVTAWSWRWVFVVFFVIAAIGAVVSAVLLRDSGRREERSFDTPGWLMSTAVVVGLVLVSREASSLGLTSVVFLAGAAATVFVGVALVRRSLRRPDPLIAFEMFATPAFSATIIVSSMFSYAQLARLNVLPIQLAVVRDLDARDIGVVLVPTAIGLMLTMPVGGWLVDRVGARWPAALGLGINAVCMWQLSRVGVDASIWVVAASLLVQGIGTGLAFVPITVAGMIALPDRYAVQASMMTNLVRQMSGAIGIAIAGTFLAHRLGAVAPDLDAGGAPTQQAALDAYADVFLISGVFLAAGAAFAALMPGRAAVAARRRRAVELAEPATSVSAGGLGRGSHPPDATTCAR